MITRKMWGPAVVALAMLALGLTPGKAQGAGPFADMGGQWTGSGLIAMSDGKRERLRCRANYTASDGGNLLDLGIRCASDSYRFDLSGYMSNRGGAISGQWSETTFNAAGTLSGRVSGRSVNALAVGTTFSARLSLSTGGSRQTVTIRPEGTQVDRVTLSLSKR
jgi:hypothetical protein